MLRFHKEIIIFLFHIRKPTKEEINEAIECKKEYKEKGYLNLSKIKGKLVITVDAHKLIVNL